MFGPTDPFGHKAGNGRREPIRYRRDWIGICGWARPRGARIRRSGLRQPAGADVVAFTSHSPGEAGWTSAPAPWAIWPVIPSIGHFERLSWNTRLKSKRIVPA